MVNLFKSLSMIIYITALLIPYRKKKQKTPLFTYSSLFLPVQLLLPSFSRLCFRISPYLYPSFTSCYKPSFTLLTRSVSASLSRFAVHAFLPLYLFLSPQVFFLEVHWWFIMDFCALSVSHISPFITLDLHFQEGNYYSLGEQNIGKKMFLRHWSTTHYETWGSTTPKQI